MTLVTCRNDVRFHVEYPPSSVHSGAAGTLGLTHYVGIADPNIKGHNAIQIPVRSPSHAYCTVGPVYRPTCVNAPNAAGRKPAALKS